MITLYCISDVWKQAINICPFTTKVELFMKINKIDYKKNISLFNVQTSPTSNVPWIEHNNNKISESDNIIEYINYTFKLEPPNLSLDELMEAKLIKHLMEDNLNWVIKYLRHYYDKSYKIIENDIIGSFAGFAKGKRAKIIKTCKNHGIGNLNIETIIHDSKFTLKLLSHKLGTHKYFLKKDKIGLLDTIVFSFLVNLMYSPFPHDPLYQHINNDPNLENLRNYVNNIKNKYF